MIKPIRTAAMGYIDRKNLQMKVPIVISFARWIYLERKVFTYAGQM
ncbi:hypothetical protein B0I21_10128 [Sphingobacterium paludis]|jgi:hypothetical protein|uniref:Uncharacterized protein n=1 Tax=Sphingobacterium paludis TaxID=1476465 RepID=A0A4R7D8Y0_9SPHI|nr:hypothetical protein B0I21_10128 [Sphingobacterium paludis]